MDLHPHEVRILKALDSRMGPGELAEKAGLSVDAVGRASSWLKTKGLVEVVDDSREVILLGPEGEEYVEAGLPERRLLEVIGDGVELKTLKDKTDPDLFSIGFGWLRRKAQISVEAGFVKPLNKNETLDEKLLKEIKSKKTVSVAELNPGQKKAFEDLKSRKNVIEIKLEKHISFKSTSDGKKLAKKTQVDERVGELTQDMLKSGDWSERGFRPYDVSVYQKPMVPAKIHPLSREIRKVRKIFTNMGFREIKGPLVESAFWNFDALFQPQDHPARDMHDTFYLEKPKNISLEDFDKYKADVGKTHEDGWTTESTGWGYKWDEKIAKKTILRTHTTPVTARELGKLTAEDMPVKVFCIGKAFRNEAVDYKHLPEFYQVEGIVVDPQVNFRHLLGILTEFYKKMGYEKIRFRPAYFPYTEMSVEPEVYFPEKDEWIELGGAGIFRPEVVKPLLGVDVPVLAWGLGLERILMKKLNIKDIRQLYISDLDWLKEN